MTGERVGVSFFSILKNDTYRGVRDGLAKTKRITADVSSENGGKAWRAALTEST